MIPGRFWIMDGIDQGRLPPPIDFGGQLLLTSGGQPNNIRHPKTDWGDPYALDGEEEEG